MFEKDLIHLSAFRPSHRFHRDLVWFELLILATLHLTLKLIQFTLHSCLCVPCSLLFLSGGWSLSQVTLGARQVTPSANHQFITGHLSVY